MRIAVEPLLGSHISSLISSFYGIDRKQLDLFDYCQTLGEVYTGFVDGEFICCWGLVPPSFLSNQAYLWMWAPNPMKHQFVFIRRSQIQVQKMLERYDQIVGDCEEANKSAQRWLQWLGAEFDVPKAGLIHFVIKRANG